MKACLIYRNVRNATWIVKRHLAVRSGVKGARRGYYHIEILLSSHGVEKKESRGVIVGVKGQGAHIYVFVGPRAQFEDSK